ncbi:MAG: 50S ribosomal protein L9 [bacterium]
MQVILKEHIENIGQAGDLINVAPGFARNYLLPKKLAILADARNIKQLEHQKRLKQAIKEKHLKDCEKLARSLESLSLTIIRKAGENDRLFGSVTTIDIAEALKNEGIEIERKRMHLEEPIKSLGIYTIPIRLHQEVTANLKVWVVKE